MGVRVHTATLVVTRIFFTAACKVLFYWVVARFFFYWVKPRQVRVLTLHVGESPFDNEILAILLHNVGAYGYVRGPLMIL